jgi:energy-coupling factor transport system ATP-binding protein
VRIRVEELRHEYPGAVVALDGVSVTFESGEMVAIVGENGAGKTTLVKHLNGLLKPTAGRVRVGETDTADATVAALAGHIGYVFQNPDDQLFSRTVRQEVSVGPRNLGRPEADVDRLVRHALEATGLEDVADENPYDVPPTRRKLVAIAAVLSMDTPTLVIDEPTVGQDGAGMTRIGEILGHLSRAGKGVIAITHDIDFAAETFDRMIVMSGGRIVGDGPTPQMVDEFDLLEGAAVEPPQLTRLARELKLTGAVYDQGTFLQRLSAGRERADREASPS